MKKIIVKNIPSHKKTNYDLKEKIHGSHEKFMSHMRSETGHRRHGTKEEITKANKEMMKGYGGEVATAYHEHTKKRQSSANKAYRTAIKAKIAR